MKFKHLEYDIDAKAILPLHINGVPNYARRAPLFCAPEKYFIRLQTNITNGHDKLSLECYREEEAMNLGVELKQTGDKMENDKGEFVDIGLGVYATKPLKKGMELPMWGSIGLKSEFSDHQLRSCDRKVGVKFDLTSRKETDYIMLIHRGCVSGYINDCSAPYDSALQNCEIKIKFPAFNHNRAEYYVCVILTKNIDAREQLLCNYGKQFWAWETDNKADFTRRVRSRRH